MEVSNLAEMIYDKYFENRKNGYYLNVINVIDKIPFMCKITWNLFRDERVMFFVIEFDCGVYGLDESGETFVAFREKLIDQKQDFTKEDFEEALEKIKITLQNLRYNCLLNKMYDITKKDDYLECYNYFGISYMNIDDCCVCHEKTQLKTNCKHTLCALCWNKLKKRECPICRNDSLSMYEDECEDD